jgi:hypothetical protein
MNSQNIISNKSDFNWSTSFSYIPLPPFLMYFPSLFSFSLDQQVSDARKLFSFSPKKARKFAHGKPFQPAACIIKLLRLS